jgi:hypothetical protein
MKILFPLIFLLLIYLPTNTEGAISMFRNVDLTQSGTQLHPDTTLGDRSNPAQNCRMTVGDLDGDNKIEFVFNDKIEFVFNDGQRVIQAFDDDGTRLWSYFDSSARTEEELYHNFTIQVYDIDLDGKDEIIAFKIISSNQHVVVMNGETGANQATLQLDFGLPTGFFDHHHIAIANTQDFSITTT